MERSILDLSPEELSIVQKTNKLPDNVSLKGIEERKDFDILYKHRNNLSMLAEHLLKGSKTLEHERLLLKKEELELRKEKAKGQTFLLKDLKAHLTRIETKLDLLVQSSILTNKLE